MPEAAPQAMAKGVLLSSSGVDFGQTLQISLSETASSLLREESDIQVLVATRSEPHILGRGEDGTPLHVMNGWLTVIGDIPFVNGQSPSKRGKPGQASDMLDICRCSGTVVA